MSAIRLALDTVEKLKRELDDAKGAFRSAWTRAATAEKRAAAMEKILRDYAFTDRADFGQMRLEAIRVLSTTAARCCKCTGAHAHADDGKGCYFCVAHYPQNGVAKFTPNDTVLDEPLETPLWGDDTDGTEIK